AANTSLGGDENEPSLKMAERHDWVLFRSIEGVRQKAGVPADKLRRLVLKELADNALDEATSCRSGFDKDRDVYFVEDLGRGLDGTPQEIASLFSIRRPDDDLSDLPGSDEGTRRSQGPHRQSGIRAVGSGRDGPRSGRCRGGREAQAGRRLRART